MPMTMTQKILADHAGLESVAAGHVGDNDRYHCKELIEGENNERVEELCYKVTEVISCLVEHLENRRLTALTVTSDFLGVDCVDGYSVTLAVKEFDSDKCDKC